MQNFSAPDDSSTTNANGTPWSGGAVVDYATLSDLADPWDCMGDPKRRIPSVRTNTLVSFLDSIE